ncbi:MAG: OmpA family protein [Alphaproteobacteria bacterium]|nr:OmpA family protein [Alphaproteobacteria bacterium]
MKIRNYAMMLCAAGLLAACGGSSKVTEIDPATNPMVFFAFDKSDITEEARHNLLGQALYMKNNPSTEIMIAGNADERGTVEYNLALGARRANAAKNVIVRDGVDANRIQTISYGKERPFKLGTGEEVWKWNRNATTTKK